jgi:multidrug efflux system outer membrane protein
MFSGCAVGPDFQKPLTTAPSDYGETGPWKEAAPKASLPKPAWWKIFQDPVLDDLEAKVASANPTLRASLARVEQAAAIARLSQAQIWPQLNANFSPSRTRYSGNREVPPGSVVFPYTVNSIDLPLALSYEIDLFGQVRRSLESARAAALAQKADYQNVLLSLQALTAEDYFALRSLLAQGAILDHTIELRRQALKLVHERRMGGAADDLDVDQAEADLDSVEGDKAAVDRQVADARHGLSVLAGELPANYQIGLVPLAGIPPSVPAGLPSELLERRPDVTEAEENLAAANAQIGVAKAAFFPAITLTGYAGVNSTAFSTLFDSPAREWSIAPFVSLPIFRGGANLANYRRSQAAYDEAVANYRQQVLIAFSDVENGLSDLRTLAEQSADVERAVQAATRAADLSIVRYKEGVADYFEVIDAERTALTDQLQAAALQGQRFVSTVLLVKALGGGW